MPRTYRVISPHLDDAALSCSLFLAANPGSALITVFASGPPSVRPLTPWDRAARFFDEGADVMGVRRAEDARAADLVRASPVHLRFWDRQYRNERYGYPGPAEEDLVPLIAADLLSDGQLSEDRLSGGPPSEDRPSEDRPSDNQHSGSQRPGADGWVIPLGLGHPDHRLAADAGLHLAALLRDAPGSAADVFVYQELPYAVEDPADVASRRHLLAEHGFALAEEPALEFSADRKLKKAVFRCHASQRRTLRRRSRTAIRTPEHIWRLIPS